MAYKIDEEKKLAKSTPNVDTIKDWITQAQKTDPKIEY